MSNTLKSLAIGLASLSIGCAAMAGGSFADPSEPHGVVRTDVEKTASQIFPVDVVEVDGDLVSVDDKNAIWLTPGEHTLTVRSVVDLNATFGIKRTVGYSDGPNEVTLTVEPGKVYYVGMKALQGEKHNWKPVVWKVAES